jgi:hypothetical protein
MHQQRHQQHQRDSLDHDLEAESFVSEAPHVRGVQI